MATTRGWSRFTIPGRIKARLRGVGVVAPIASGRSGFHSAVIPMLATHRYQAPSRAPAPGVPPRRGHSFDCE